jgi:toxin HigB-1
MGIKNFIHKGVEDVFFVGHSKRIGSAYLKRMKTILDAMHAATCVADLEGAHGFHELRGDRAGTYSMSVSGNWRLTFRFEHGDKGDIIGANFEDYH